jgi:hypothetical protein
VRIALVLLAASGCDAALGLEHIEPITGACGPYNSVKPVTINGVSDPRGFSITPDGSLALVTGKDAADQTRPIVLKANGDTWEPDPAMQNGLVAAMKGALLAPPEPMPVASTYPGEVLQPVMLLSTIPSGQSKAQVGRYFWSASSNAWSLDTNEPAFSLSGYDVFPGNVSIKVGATNSDVDRVRHTVLWMVTQDASEGPNKIAITANTPPSFTLEDKARTVGINSLGKRFGQAVLTDDRAKLVYSAESGTSRGIYAVEQNPDSRTFDDAGGLVAGIDDEGDEVEPWINGDCSKLYFRRIPADTPNEAGQIFVAE